MTRFVVDCGVVIHLASEGIEVPAEHKILAPTLLRSQTLSALHEAVHRGELPPDVAHERLARIRALPIRLLGDAVLLRRAWDLAEQLGWAETYDAEDAAVQELQAGLWYWTATHPEWTPANTEGWGPEVSSYAVDDGNRLLLFDPIAPPSEIHALAAERETAVVLTAPWHERDTQSLVERLGVPVFTPLPDSAQDLMEKYGITAEQAGDGSPDLVWLLRENKGEARPYSPGDRLPIGIEAFPGREQNDMVLWIESKAAVVSGDTLKDVGQGLEISVGWLREGVTREQVAEGLRPLLELPVELVLPAHGAPTDRAASSARSPN